MTTLSAKAMKEIREAVKSTQFDFFMDDGKYNESEPNNCYLRWTIESGLYKGQTHILCIRWNYGSNEPKNYPRNPPNVTFITPMWHTNVNCSGGSICVDILREDPTNAQAWSPIYGLDAIFNSIILLLEEHNTSSAYNGLASIDYKQAINENNLQSFITKANVYYHKYLNELNPKNYVARLLKAPEFDKLKS
jgi:ubiquitin-protein ligase